MTTAETIAAYDRLVARALEIVGAPPHWEYVYEPETARLSLKGDKAVLKWPKIESCYDSSTIEVQSASFPAILLVMSDAEFAAWQKEKQADCDRLQAEQEVKRVADRESKERSELAALKAKYEKSDKTR